jgi:hypothetical protein
MAPSCSRKRQPALLRNPGKGGHGVAAHGDVDALDAAGKIAPYAVFRSTLASASSPRAWPYQPLARLLWRAVGQGHVALKTVFPGGRTRMSWWVETT